VASIGLGAPDHRLVATETLHLCEEAGLSAIHAGHASGHVDL
jgi:hypothetical protein